MTAYEVTIGAATKERIKKTGYATEGYIGAALDLYAAALDEGFVSGNVRFLDGLLSPEWFGPEGAKLVAAARARSIEDAVHRQAEALRAVIAEIP